ncbi:hypothetical protein [Microbacterium sp.]|uniref:hypothetical protein n=1 Tax=Microbacterium sp. TaxID=51671 RepID=UPI0039E258BA
MSPQRRRLIKRLLIGIGSIAALVAAGSIVVSVLNSQRGPESVVQAYLDHLSSGDATGAAELVDPGVPNGQRTLLTDEALTAADHRLKVVALHTEAQGDAANVTATLSVDGEQFEHVFTARKGPTEFLLLDTWQVTQSLISPVQVTADATDEVLLGDLVIPASRLGNEQFDPLWIYPGSYTFTAADDRFYDSGEVAVRILSPDGGIVSVHVEQTPSEALRDLVLEKARQRVTACATVPTNVDAMCPAAARRTDLESLTVTALPDGLEDLTLTEWTADEAVITTQRQPSTFMTFQPEKTTFRLSGTIDLSGEEPVVSFGDAGWW